jgi:phosphoglycolate phosphatase-like HAD superfamily hydrolase
VIALFWDIDGTLLTTARAGVASLEDALAQITGVRVELAEVKTAGLTDYAIAEEAIRGAGVEPSEAAVMEFLRLHSAQLERYLGLRRGHVMPGVREILEDVDRRDDVANVLLTGNTEEGAWAKLRHYGLAQFFPRGGAFCAGPGERAEIARRARALVNGIEELYVIGDTPSDIAAGESIGARTIAVATGSYSLDELETHRPWRALERLPAPTAFRGLVGLTR